MAEIDARYGAIIFAGMGLAVVFALLLIPSYAGTDTYFINSGGGSGGETTECINMASQYQVIVNSTDGNCFVRSLANGTNVTLVTNSTHITISASGSGETTVCSGQSGNYNIVASSSGGNCNFKNLLAGTGITLSSNSTHITVANNIDTCAEVIGSVCYNVQNDIGANVIMINATSPPVMQLIGEGAGAGAGLELYRYGQNPSIAYFRAQGSQASPTAVVSGNVIGANQGNGYDGNSFETGANFRFVATGTWSDTNRASKVELRCVAPSSTTVFTCLTVDEFGLSQPNIDYSLRTVSASGTTNLALTDYIVLCNANANSVTLNLPTPSSGDNRLYVLKRIDANVANTCTIATNGSETIDTFSTITLPLVSGTSTNPVGGIVVAWDGSNWWIVA